jgi:hypothetical protein
MKQTLRSSTVTLQSWSPFFVRLLLIQVAQNYAGAKMVYSRAVFILENYFATKSFSALPEAFSNAFPDKEILNKTTIHRLASKYRDARLRECGGHF